MRASVTVDILFILFILFISPRVNTQNIVMGRTRRGHLYTLYICIICCYITCVTRPDVTCYMARGVTGTWRTNTGSCSRVTMMLSFSTYLHLGTRFQFPNDRDDKWGNLGLKYWAPHGSLICSQLGSSISTLTAPPALHMASMVLGACVYGLWLCPYPYPPFLESRNMTRMQRMFTQNSVLLLTSEILGLWNISWIIVCRMWNCRWRWQAPCPSMTDDGMRCIMFTVAVLIPSVLISAGSHRGQLIMSHLSHCDVNVCETIAVWCQAFLYRGLTLEVDVGLVWLISFYWQLEEGKITCKE